MSINEIIEKVAEMNNTTAEEVYAEMQMAINAGFRNPDPQVQKEWEKVSYRGGWSDTGRCDPVCGEAAVKRGSTWIL